MMQGAEDLQAAVEGLNLADSDVEGDVAEQIRAERTNPRPDWLWNTVYDMHKFSEELKSKFFDLFYFNFEKAITTECMTAKTFIPAFVALLGILKLESVYFKLDQAHEDKFLKTWPPILQYLKIVLAGRYVLMFPTEFFDMAAGIFSLANTIHAEILVEKEAFEVAVSLWYGCLALDGKFHYAAQPLLVCLLQDMVDDDRPNYLSNLYEPNREMLMEQTLARIETATHRADSMEVGKTSRLCVLMDVLEVRCKQTMVKTFLLSRTGPYLIGAIDTLLNAPDVSAEHMRAAGLCCKVIYRCIQLGPAYATQIVQAGVLERLIKVASLKEVQDEARDALCSIFMCLIHEDVVKACQRGLYDQHCGDQLVKERLKKTYYDFQCIWENFEIAALEQSALSRLFIAGYAPELEACANHTCDKLASRSLFKLCSKCGNAVYCSYSCQKHDWPFHKPDCRKVAKEIANTAPNGLNRFTFRMAAVHIARHIAPIGLCAMGHPNRLNDSNMGVLINYDMLPFRVKSFDYQLFLKDDTPISSTRHQVVANEVLSLKEAGRECMMVVLRMNGSDVPFIFNMDGHFDGPDGHTRASGWAKELSNIPPKAVAASTILTENSPASYKGEADEMLESYFVDALRATVGYARMYAEELGEPVWCDRFLDKAVGSVIGEFKEEMRKWNVGENEARKG